MQTARLIVTDYIQDYEGLTLHLNHEASITVPIGKLVVPKTFCCTLNDILKVCDQITLGVELDPIVINDDFLIVDGVTRYYAYRRLTFQKIAVTKPLSNHYDFEDEFGIIKDFQ